MGVIARAWGVLIEALYSDDPRRQMWASDKILSSWLARDHLSGSGEARLSWRVGRQQALR